MNRTPLEIHRLLSFSNASRVASCNYRPPLLPVFRKPLASPFPSRPPTSKGLVPFRSAPLEGPADRRAPSRERTLTAQALPWPCWITLTSVGRNAAIHLTQTLRPRAYTSRQSDASPA